MSAVKVTIGHQPRSITVEISGNGRGAADVTKGMTIKVFLTEE